VQSLVDQTHPVRCWKTQL